MPPPPDTCTVGCEDLAKQANDACLAAQNDVPTCEAQARGVLETCLTQECGAAPPSTCPEQCETKARAKLRKALDRHGNPERAARRAQGAFQRCVKRCEPK